jgi:hypothetical protein
MRSNNNNETITHLAIPERQIPVLIDSGSGRATGFVPSSVWSDKPITNVRRVPAESILDSLKTPEQRNSFEKEFGPVPEAAWNELLELIALWDRLSVGDYAPVLKSRSSNMKRGRKGLRQNIELSFNLIGKSPRLGITEAFTKGLRNAKLVVWWSTVANKAVLGLYCPDAATALNASVLSALGTAGGIGVCQKCRIPFTRTRAKQRYCDHKCQVAAGMQRHRNNLKLKAESTSKIPATKKHTQRK